MPEESQIKLLIFFLHEQGPTAGDEPQQQSTQVLETMSSSKYETALIKRSLEGFKTDYSQPPLDAYIPKDDKNARYRTVLLI
jgi:hypothetical protein